MARKQAEGAKTAEKNAGAFMAGFGMYAMPTDTLSDDAPGDPAALDLERGIPNQLERSSRPVFRRLVLLIGALAIGSISFLVLFAMTPA